MTPNKHRKKGRGRPRKRRVAKFADSVSEYCARTGKSRATAFREMAAGLLKYAQIAPGFPRQIPHSEYRRLGFDVPLDDSNGDSQHTA
jgi:hypothetical protein